VGGELICQAECGRPIGLVRARGTLSRRTSPALRAAVHECLADQPDAVVVDLTELTTERDAGLGFLAAMARAAVAYAGVSILLCTPSPQLRETFGQLGVTRQLPVCASLAEAMALARQSSPARRVRRQLPTGPMAGEVARDVLAEACLRWRIVDVVDRMATILTELVANAVLHAGTELTLSVAVSGAHLYVAVHDRSPQLPRLGGGDGPDTGAGSGLLVVDALAEAWGFAPTAAGKVVWASVEVDVPPQAG
jgi:anti-anti-sigma factor